MIKINLAPLDELESQYWFWPDASCFLLVAIIGYFAVGQFLNGMAMNAEEFRQQASSYTENYNRLAPELARYDNLEKEIRELNERMEALKRITESKIARYRPVIVLEHLQSLKPEGLWFRKLTVPKGDQVTLEGQALDNLLIADFISAILSTKGQPVDSADLRSQLFFDGVTLDKTVVTEGERGGGGSGDTVAPYYDRFPLFTINFRYEERAANAAPAEQGKKPVASLFDRQGWFLRNIGKL